MNTARKEISDWLIAISRFWRWHPTVALRYLPIVDEIRRLSQQGFPLQTGDSRPGKIKVLEIGSGSLGIAPYLGREVTGVDVDFGGPAFPLLRQVKGEATDLSFSDQSFDFVVTVDVLEHLPPQKRKKAIFEALRVAKKKVFIAVPCGKSAEEQDQQLHEEYRRIFGKPFSFLQEQVRFGLPPEKEIIDYIKTSAKKLGREVKIEVKRNLNLTVRKFLMWGWMTKNPVIDILFRKVFLIFIPILRHCNWEPTYRRMFFCDVKQE